MKSNLFLTILSGGLLALVLFQPALAAESPAGKPANAQAAAPAQKSAPAKAQAMPDIPEEYIVEAKDFYTKCSHNPSFFQYYDCKCLAKSYLNRRIDVGPEKPQSLLLMDIQYDCPDATLAAGDAYNTCLTQTTGIPQNMDVEDYCECYANTYVKLYETYGATPSSDTFINVQKQAYLTCSDPGAARRLYPVQVKDFGQKLR